jgi:hypothetical protein
MPYLESDMASKTLSIVPSLVELDMLPCKNQVSTILDR